MNGGTHTTLSSQRTRSVRATDGLALDLIPACPFCGDLVEPPYTKCCRRSPFLSQYELDRLRERGVESRRLEAL